MRQYVQRYNKKGEYFDSHWPRTERPIPKDLHCIGKMSDA